MQRVTSAATPPLIVASRAAAPSGLATVVFLGVVAGTQMSDRGLQSVLLPGIRQTFGVGDAEVGALQGMAGILIGSALAVPLARLSDTLPRTRVLLGLIAAWTLLTALGALAPSFPLFFAGRSASGVTEFAMIPVVYSLIPDLVPEHRRVQANLLFAALMAVGASLGFYFGGTLLQLMTASVPPAALAGIDPWRRVLLLLSLAGLPLLAAGLLVREPARGVQAAQATDPSLAAFVRAHLRTILPFIGTAGGLAVAVQAVTPMIAMAVERRFAVDLAQVGHVLGLIVLATSLGCLPLAGLIDRRLAPRYGVAARPISMAAAAALALPCAALLGVTSDHRAAFALVAAFLFVTGIGNAMIPTMLQDLIPAELRARSFATYSFIVACFCAVGPLLSGALSDRAFEGDLLVAIAAAAVPALLAATASALLATRAAYRR